MPFQSTNSLNAARPLTSRATTNAPNQNQPAPQSPSMRVGYLLVWEGNFRTVSPSRT